MQKVKKFTKIYGKRVYDSSPHLNLIMPLLGAKEPQPRTKNRKTQSTIKYTRMLNKTQIYAG